MPTSAPVLSGRRSQRLAEAIRAELAGGRFQPGQQFFTVEELCSRFGTSPQTALKCVKHLSQEGLLERRARSGTYVRRLPPNQRAAATTPRTPKARTGRIMLVRWDREPAWTDATRGIAEVAGLHDDEPIVIETPQECDAFMRAVENPPASVGGILLWPYFNDEPFKAALRRLRREGVHVVQMIDSLDGLDAPCITFDNRLGGAEATRHLIELHGEPVHHFGFTTQVYSVSQRCLGWSQTMENHGYFNWRDYFVTMGHYPTPQRPTEQSHGVKRLDAAYEKALALFRKREQRRYSIFCTGDWTAVGVYQAAQEMNLVIGRDVFVVGFIDRPMARRLTPPLSSVFTDWVNLGRQAAAVLYQQLEGRVSQPIHRLLAVEPRWRESSTGLPA